MINQTMNTNNRVEVINSLGDEEARVDAYHLLDYNTAQNLAEPLTQAEINSLFTSLRHERSPRARVFMWWILANSPRQEEIKKFALSCLEDIKCPDRELSLFYLAKLFPALMPPLFERYRDDSNEDVRYVLTDYLLQSDPDQALDMKIDLLPVKSHENYDALVMEISELGNKRHLQKLRERDQEAGGNTVFGEMADSVTAPRKLRKASKADVHGTAPLL